MDLFDVLKTRRSVRAYSDQPIPPEILDRLKEAIRVAPSACNIQPWHFVLVADAGLREKLAAASYKQSWMAKAAIIVVACGIPAKAYKYMGGYGNSIDVDLAIAVDHLTLAAASEGLGTCWVGAFDEAQVKVLLGIPANVKVVAMTPLGYPATADLIRPLDPSRRKPVAELFSVDKYQGPTE